MKRAVFLDRDGVLCDAIVRSGRAHAPTALQEFRLVGHAASQVARLRQAGFVCLVFTNQPELARGTLAPDALQAMHRLLQEQITIDGVYVCPHDPSDGCECHKPKPGMLRAAARDWSLSLQDSFVIGDRWRDVDAGRAVGCFTILLERPYSACFTADACRADLEGAVDLVLAQGRGSPWTS
jgi:D-glycero-D-manno-heptose 1,7-bisphosphate phosphatase